MERHLQLVVARPKHEPRPAKVVQLEARRQARAEAAAAWALRPDRPAA
jgi:hypothetical protein